MFGTTRRTASAEAAARAAATILSGGAAGDAALARAGATALAALLAARHLDHPVDLPRVLEMALAPAAGEVPLDPDNGLHLRALLLELETAGTSEAKLVHALGALLQGRGYAGRDRFLGQLADALADSADLRAAG